MNDVQASEYRILLGKHVRRLREQQGLSLRKLALMSGVSHVYLLGIEQGKQNPTVDVLFKVATSLGMGPRDILP